MRVADVFFVHAMYSAGATWNLHPPVISLHLPATGRRVHRRRLTNASRLGHAGRYLAFGTRCVQNALPWCMCVVMCVALTKDLVHDARERCDRVDENTVLRKGCFRVIRVIHAHRDFPFLWCSAPISWV